MTINISEKENKGGRGEPNKKTQKSCNASHLVHGDWKTGNSEIHLRFQDLSLWHLKIFPTTPWDENS